MNLRDFIFSGFVLASGCVFGVLLNRQLESQPGRSGAIESGARETAMRPAEPVAEFHQEAGDSANGTINRAESPKDLGGQWQDLKKERNPQRQLRKRDAFLATMDAAQVAAHLREFQRPGSSESELVLAGALMARWAEIDPQGALEHAQSIGIRPLRAALLQAAAGSWAAEQPGAAMEWVKDLPPGEFRRGVLESIVAAAGKRDPSTALKFIDLLPPHEQSQLQHVQAEIFRDWTSRDPDLAAARVLALPEGRDREGAMIAVASTWAATNPEAALAWIEKIPNETTRSTSLLNAIGLWAQADEQAAANYLLSMPPGATRDQGICAAMREMAKRDNAAALNFFNSIPVGEARENAAHIMVQEMAVQNSPAAAASFVAALPPGKTQEDAAYSLAMQWGALDVKGAVDWASNLSGSIRSNSLRMVLDVWSQNDPKKAAEYLQTKAPGQAQEIMKDIAAAESSPEQAIAWAQQIKDPQIREGVISDVVDWLSASDPRGAAKYLNELSGEAQATATENVVSTWAQGNPGSAARWALTLPDNELRTRAMTQLMIPWAEKDPAAAAGWLEKLPAGASRDAAVSVFARQVASTDPQSAASWATSIGDPQSRGTELEMVGRRWMQLDPNAARRWISQNNAISDEAKNNLLAPRK